MQNGNLSNEVVPRFLITFENLLGHHPSKADQLKAGAFLKARQWSRAVKTYQLSEGVAAKIWNDTMRFSKKFEAVTFISPHLVDPIQEWIDAYEVPVGRVHYYEPDKLARKLAYLPDVALVMSPYPDHQFKFGSKGRVVTFTQHNSVGVI